MTGTVRAVAYVAFSRKGPEGGTAGRLSLALLILLLSRADRAMTSRFSLSSALSPPPCDTDLFALAEAGASVASTHDATGSVGGSR